MTIDEWLNISIKKLESASIPTAKLDAEVLLADLLDKDRTWIHAHSEYKFSNAESSKLDEQINRRIKHEPLAYIRGKQEFFGRNFTVSADTLTPRPETETMIEMLLDLKPVKIIDVGTGSGCIAITAKLELPKSEVYGIDISDKCLEVAKQNAINLESEVEFYKSDLLQDINVKLVSESVLCCNLPYVPTEFKINTAATHEPKIAIFGGEDGLDLYRHLFEQIIILPMKYKPIVVFTEALPSQHDDLEMLAFQANYKLVETRDFIQYFTLDF